MAASVFALNALMGDWGSSEPSFCAHAVLVERGIAGVLQELARHNDGQTATGLLLYVFCFSFLITTVLAYLIFQSRRQESGLIIHGRKTGRP